jgi:multiple sugar transport system substrate-binding protein
MLTSVFITAQLYTSASDPVTITWLTHWTDPRETGYWDGVIAKYEALNPNIHITMVGVTFDVLLQEIMLRHASDTDTDMIHFYDMWLPGLANWVTEILAIPPDDVQADVRANWQPASVNMTTYKSIVYGYPTELDTWALVYDHKLIKDAIDAGNTALIPILNKLNVTKEPLTWGEFETAARALAKWEDGTLTQTGFLPMVAAEQGRFQFLSMLWSNGGEYLDLTVPTTLFDTPNGYGVMQLYYDLGWVEPRAYDPLNMPDYWWGAWVDETVAMMMLPTWMTYIRDAMGENFNHLGVAPIPIGPSGTESVSNSYGWMVGVSEKAVREGRADAAWDFLRWLNTPRAAGYITSPPMAEAYGAVPKGEGCTIMGDFLIFDSIIPSKKDDQTKGKTTIGYDAGHGEPGDFLSSDFWFKGYMDVANIYGRPSIDNLKSAQIDTEINLMFDRVVLTGANPPTEVHEAAIRVNAILPLPGDINLDGFVDIQDIPLLITDMDATPSSPNWNRGRSDINDDGVVNRLDLMIGFGGSADIAVTNVEPYKTVVGQGYSTDIDVTVENEGDFTETFDVTAYYDGNAIGTQTVNNLPSGNSVTLTFTWDTTGVAKGSYTISAHATPVLGETHTADNTFTDGTVTVTQSVAVQPKIIIGPPPKIGEIFTVNITVVNVTDLYTWQAGMTFNPSVLKALSIAEGEFLKRAGVTTLWTPGSIDNTNGIIHYSACSITGSTPGVNGSGQLMSITFKVKNNGNSALNLTDVLLLNSSLMPIEPVYIVDGYVEIHLQDVAILSVTTSATEAYPTWNVPLNITVVVENQGTKTETFYVIAYANETAIETKTVTLDAGASKTLVFNWNLTGVDEGNYTISAEASVLYGEIDTADNTLTDGTVKIKHPGDANDDGVVNAYDLGMLAKAWGTKVGDPLYDPRVDFNGDGKIDEKDHDILKANWP